MSSATVPSSVKSDLEKACQKAVDKVKKVAPGEKNEKKLADLLNKQVCKEVDKKILAKVAEEIAKIAKGKSAKAPKNTPPKVDAKPSLKKPGSGSPSLKIPLANIDLFGDKKKDTKIEVILWADPRDLEKDKGVMVNVTVMTF